MNKSCRTIWETDTAQQLASIVAATTDLKQVQSLLRDVMTEKEIIEVSARLEAAKLLDRGVKYTEIIEKTKLSSRTIARISDWMKNGCGGYAQALKQINSSHSHISPVRAE